MISVSNIERFAIHDGPGIRTTVFLKGCMLHCPWCANPETWGVQPVLMHDERKCVHCRLCEKHCPQKAITFEPDFHIDYSLCRACGTCTQTCIPNALEISGKWMTAEEILDEATKDKKYYENSQGGITLSGGEPLFQFEESFELIQRIHEEEFHLALETTGNYSLEKLQKVEPYVDLFLMDCKHLDPEKLYHVTGADYDQIMENFAYLSKHCPQKVIVRMPVIWDFNQDQIEKIIEWAATLHFPEVDLLPYHSLAKNKWENLQMKYSYAQYPLMDKKDLMPAVEYGKKIGIRVKIGG